MTTINSKKPAPPQARAIISSVFKFPIIAIKSPDGAAAPALRFAFGAPGTSWGSSTPKPFITNTEFMVVT